MGLDHAALAALLDYGWPGNDAELEATLLGAALATDGEVIGVRELERIGFRVARASGELPVLGAVPRSRMRKPLRG